MGVKEVVALGEHRQQSSHNINPAGSHTSLFLMLLRLAASTTCQCQHAFLAEPSNARAARRQAYSVHASAEGVPAHRLNPQTCPSAHLHTHG